MNSTLFGVKKYCNLRSLRGKSYIRASDICSVILLLQLKSSGLVGASSYIHAALLGRNRAEVIKYIKILTDFFL